MSMDQELTKKAYSDYANLDDGDLSNEDTTYRDDFDYYGYFDPNWCYTYDNSAADNLDHFKPAIAATGAGNYKHQCVGGGDVVTKAGAWSGNFLNWMSMTRMDILRKVLFGGMRSVDTATQTILERAYIPADVHAFVKVYKNNDIAKYTPYDHSIGHEARSFCNVTPSGTTFPIIRTAPNTDGYYFWASTEGQQCLFGANSAPAGGDTFTAKVEVCVTGKDKDSERCRPYGSSNKPAGLLQKHGEAGAVNFSLVTGSYKQHLKGGVLRKAAGPFVDNDSVKHGDPDDEINLDDGTVNNAVSGIIRNVNSFRVANYNNGNYTDCNTHSIQIATVVEGTTGGRTCTDWGNPIAETYLEMLRYLSGNTAPTAAFYNGVSDATTVGNITGVPGLSEVTTWVDPWADWCSKCAVIVLSTGGNSFDSDDLATASDIVSLGNAAAVFAKTDAVGEKQYGTFSGSYFAGSLAAGSRNCESRRFTKLSDVKGICPELPALEGSYNIAGLAYHAHTTDLRPSLQGDQKVTTYTVDLAESLPTFVVGVDGKRVTFTPACEASPGTDFQSCTLTNATVSNLVYVDDELASGDILLTWEDSTWGNDYDLDAAQHISFCVGSACSPAIDPDELRIINTVPYAAAGNEMHLSYSIYGVSAAVTGGIYLGATSVTGAGVFQRNGVDLAITTPINYTTFGGGLFTPWTVRPGGQNYISLAGTQATIQSSKVFFTAGTTATTKQLPKPLWLAAKFGGFLDKNGDNEFDSDDIWDKQGFSADSEPDGIPDNFFGVKNPARLEESLDAIIVDIIRKTSSASAVATSSTRLNVGSFLYQAAFNSKEWSGELRTYAPNATTGILSPTPYKTTTSRTAAPTANDMQTTAANRKIITYVGGNTVDFEWTNLDSTKKTALTSAGDAAGLQIVDWIQGNDTYEKAAPFFRSRDYTDSDKNNFRNILGDIVNSSPAYAGVSDFKYTSLPNGDTYDAFVATKESKAPLVLVGANDGMLHAFNATGTSLLREVFAYIPSFSYPKLAKLTQANYGTTTNPHEYLVDGAVTIGDVYVNSAWRTIAVGSMGAGGKGIYVLDITDSSSPSVLFEYTHPDMGYVLGKIFIVPTQAGRWAIVFGNGDSSGTTSKLFMVDVETPASSWTWVIPTAAGTTGLANVAVLLDESQRLSSVYGGDLNGNMWHFDTTGSSSYLVFASPEGQPITAAPTIGYNSILNKKMVYFGTGRYYMPGDNLVSSQQQRFYAVPDLGGGTAVVLTDLLEKTMTTSYTAEAETRTISTTNPNWGTEKGWYIDLDQGTGLDERVVSKAILIQDRLIITTLLPNSIPCDAGGKSWFMEITAIGDKCTSCVPVLPKFSDEVFLGDANVSLSAVGGGVVNITRSGSSGNISVEAKAINVNGVGRQSWRQLR